MNEAVVKRVKLAWGVAWLCTTGLVLVAWGFSAAAAAALVFVGVSFLAFIAYVLFLLLGDAPVGLRILVIALVVVLTLVEFGALITVVGWLLRGRVG